MYVFDATPLIYLATVGRLQRIDSLGSDCRTTRAVYREVVTVGLDEGHADARRIERAVENGLVTVEEARETAMLDRLRQNQHLSTADATVLALAAETDGTAIVDERYGRTIAAAESISTRGTAYIVLRLQRDNVLSARAAQETIDEMIAAGWYCAPDLYTKISRKIDDIEQRDQ